MTQLDTKHQPLSLSFASHPDPEPARNLIVLVPDLEADLHAVTHRVWELANASGAHVKFLGLCNDAVQEPSLRRKLVTMSAIVNYGKVSADMEVMNGKNWVEVVKSRWQPGDTIVCFDQQRVGLFQKPLRQILQSDLNVPLYILSGLNPHNNPRSSWLAGAATWLGFALIILGFFILQVRIDLFTKDSTQMILLLLTVGVEFWAIWFWNSLFG